MRVAIYGGQVDPTFTFTSELTPWEASTASWVFATVPQEESEEISDIVPTRRGFGSVRVRVRIDEVEWRTSVFPDTKSGCFVLPIKKAVRKKAKVDLGDTVTLELDILIDEL